MGINIVLFHKKTKQYLYTIFINYFVRFNSITSTNVSYKLFKKILIPQLNRTITVRF